MHSRYLKGFAPAGELTSLLTYQGAEMALTVNINCGCFSQNLALLYIIITFSFKQMCNIIIFGGYECRHIKKSIEKQIFS